jgi:hypothetical protein
MEALPGGSVGSNMNTFSETNGGSTKTASLTPEENANTEVLNISGKFNSVIVTKNLAMDINDFNRLNPGFDGMLSSGMAFDLRLPGEKMDLFVRNKYAILNECIQVLLNDVNTSAAAVKTTYKRR